MPNDVINMINRIVFVEGITHEDAMSEKVDADADESDAKIFIHV